MDDILSYRILVNLFIDKIKGSGCLYESEVRKDCLTTYNVPNYKYNNPVRPKGWCEICWLRFLLEESEISRTVAISELSKSKSKLDGVTLDNIFVSSKVNQSQLSFIFDGFEDLNLCDIVESSKCGCGK